MNRKIWIQDDCGEHLICTLHEGGSWLSNWQPRYKLWSDFNLEQKLPSNVLSKEYDSLIEAIETCNKMNDLWLWECYQKDKLGSYFTDGDLKILKDRLKEYGIEP